MLTYWNRMMSLATESLRTAEQFLELGFEGSVELVKGRVLPLPPTFARHGQICARFARLLGNFAEEKSGHVISNDVCVVTQRDPDSVRNVDVAYISYLKIPKGALPPGYLLAQPDLVVEVRFPNDQWSTVLTRIVEYLNAEVSVVCILDPNAESASVYRSNSAPQLFRGDKHLRFEDILPGFSASLKQLLE